MRTNGGVVTLKAERSGSQVRISKSIDGGPAQTLDVPREEIPVLMVALTNTLSDRELDLLTMAFNGATAAIESREQSIRTEPNGAERLLAEALERGEEDGS